MFSKSVVSSDTFRQMPNRTRLLYYELCMSADDDGFVDSFTFTLRSVHATVTDTNLLISNDFIILFDSGVAVIRHWKIHNSIQKDRYHPTKYLSERSMLHLDDRNIYCLNTAADSSECIQSVDKMDTEERLGKVSVGKGRLGQGRESKEPPAPAYGEYKNVCLTDEEYEKLRSEFPDTFEAKINRLSEYMSQTGKSYKNHYATIRAWAKEDAEKEKRESEQAALPSSFDTDDFFDAALRNSYGGDIP